MAADNADITYRLITDEDQAQVREFYETVFLRDEPLSALSGPVPDHEGINALTDQFMRDVVGSGVSIVATDSASGAIIGIGLAAKSTAANPNFYDIPDHYQDAVAINERKQLQLYRDIHQLYNIFDEFGINEAIHLLTLAVSPEHRRKGIAGNLANYGIEEVRRQGYRLAYLESTSNHTRRLCDNLGFENLAEINFAQYFGEEMNTGGHDVLSLHAKTFLQVKKK